MKFSPKMLLIVFLSSLISACGSQESNSPTAVATLAWKIQTGTAGFDEATKTKIDGNGSILVTGQTTGDLHGNVNSGFYDVFVSKYDSQGNRQWTQQFGGGGSDYATDIALDSNGNVYVVGYTDGGIDGNAVSGLNDAFIAKISSSGSTLWIRQLTTPLDDKALGVAVDSIGNPYITGYLFNAFDGSPPSALSHAFVAKFDSFGQQLWFQQFRTTGIDIPHAIAIDAQGNIFVAGDTTGSFAGFTNLGYYDVFLARLDSTGVPTWIKQIGSDSPDSQSGLALDLDGNAYITGTTSGSFDQNTTIGYGDLFIVKYNTSGNKVWSRQYGTSSVDHPTAIALDTTGNIYIGGGTGGNFNGGSLPEHGDVFIMKLTSDGLKLWAQQIGTSGFETSLGIAVNGSKLFLAGYTSGSFTSAANSGAVDIFLLGYDL